jgi:hypothetical protein
MTFTIRFPDDLQALLLEGDARLVATYGDPTGDDVAPDPVYELTVGANRLMVPMYWEIEEKSLLPSSELVDPLEVADLRAGATLEIRSADGTTEVALDIHDHFDDFDESPATASRLEASFSTRSWTSRHVWPSQVGWHEYPDLREGWVAQLCWSVVWRPETALQILAEMDAQNVAKVMTVDFHRLDESAWKGVAWEEMVVVADSSPSAAISIIETRAAGRGVEMLVVPIGAESDDLLGRPPAPIDPTW